MVFRFFSLRNRKEPPISKLGRQKQALSLGWRQCVMVRKCEGPGDASVTPVLGCDSALNYGIETHGLAQEGPVYANSKFRNSLPLMPGAFVCELRANWILSSTWILGPF